MQVITEQCVPSPSPHLGASSLRPTLQFNLSRQADYHLVPNPKTSFRIPATDSGKSFQILFYSSINFFCILFLLYFYKVLGFFQYNRTPALEVSRFAYQLYLFNFSEPQFLHLKYKHISPTPWLLGILNRLAYNKQLALLYPYVFV